MNHLKVAAVSFFLLIFSCSNLSSPKNPLTSFSYRSDNPVEPIFAKILNDNKELSDLVEEIKQAISSDSDARKIVNRGDPEHLYTNYFTEIQSYNRSLQDSIIRNNFEHEIEGLKHTFDLKIQEKSKISNEIASIKKELANELTILKIEKTLSYIKEALNQEDFKVDELKANKKDLESILKRTRNIAL